MPPANGSPLSSNQLGQQHRRFFANRPHLQNSIKLAIKAQQRAAQDAAARKAEGVVVAHINRSYGTSVQSVPQYQRPGGGGGGGAQAGGGGDRAGTHETGLSGTYPIYDAAYRRAAAKLGVLPRELQSVTWEAIRQIFDEDWKSPENLAKVDKIWGEYQAGDITRKQAYGKILQIDGVLPNGFHELEGSGLYEPTATATGNPANAGKLGSVQLGQGQEPVSSVSGRAGVGATRPSGRGVGQPEPEQVIGQTAPLRKARRARALVSQ